MKLGPRTLPITVSWIDKNLSLLDLTQDNSV